MSSLGTAGGAWSRPDWLRWVTAFAAAMAIMAAVTWSLRGPIVSLPALGKPASRAVVDLVPATEQAMMHDTIPLFLPTEHDATVSLPQREDGGNILDYDASWLWFRDLNLAATLPPVVTLNGKAAEQAKPVDALVPDFGAVPLVGFGRQEARTVPLPVRGAYIEVISAVGQKVIREELPPEAAPATDKEWQPMEFAAVIDASGLALPLRVTEGSRVEDVDAYFTNYLVEKFRLGARLPPGFYRVIVGP
jgi:hypothetical protein